MHAHVHPVLVLAQPAIARPVNDKDRLRVIVHHLFDLVGVRAGQPDDIAGSRIQVVAGNLDGIVTPGILSYFVVNRKTMGFLGFNPVQGFDK